MTEQELYRFAYAGVQQTLFVAHFWANSSTPSELSLYFKSKIPYLEQCCVYLHNKVCERRPDDETDMQT